ncbi:hypothetical protein HOLleu_43647 [Holothuria leucospilota]|uniref:Uncharacterized protein n=1 Tax=Holothuria leucospilota TaxID=206669 RepID=A0A9Q0YBC2_HOLLE|nr:hypothetical protein HOLleu_43647 [Holothuria leucospilota]
MIVRLRTTIFNTLYTLNISKDSVKFLIHRPTAETCEGASREPSTTVVSQLLQMVGSPPIQPEESSSSQVGEIPSLQTESPLLPYTCLKRRTDSKILNGNKTMKQIKEAKDYGQIPELMESIVTARVNSCCRMDTPLSV